MCSKVSLLPQSGCWFVSLPWIFLRKEPAGRMLLRILVVEVHLPVRQIACFKESHEMENTMVSVQSIFSFKDKTCFGSVQAPMSSRSQLVATVVFLVCGIARKVDVGAARNWEGSPSAQHCLAKTQIQVGTQSQCDKLPAEACHFEAHCTQRQMFSQRLLCFPQEPRNSDE